MSGPWLVLVGTRAAFIDAQPIVDLVQRLPGRWHTEAPPNPLPCDVLFHFWYLPSANAATLAEISHTREVAAVIVAPELLPKSVKAPIKIRIGAGTNNVEVNEGEVCLNTPGINADATAEWAFKTMLWAMGGRSLEHIHEATVGAALSSNNDAFKELYNHELTGRSIALLGAGNIATEMARLCVARHMRVRLWTRHTDVGLACVSANADLDSVLRDAEIVSLHVPLVSEGERSTMGLLDEKRLKMMKRGAVVINFARPQLVDVNALEKLMIEGHVQRAVIDGDLFSVSGEECGPLKPFVELARKHKSMLAGRLLTLPHVGGDTSEEARVRGMAQAVRQVHEWFANRRLINLVRPIHPLLTNSAPLPQLPSHIGASISIAAVRANLENSASTSAALDALRKVVSLQEHASVEKDDEALRRLLSALRTLSQELPLDRRFE